MFGTDVWPVADPSCRHHRSAATEQRRSTSRPSSPRPFSPCRPAHRAAYCSTTPASGNCRGSTRRSRSSTRAGPPTGRWRCARGAARGAQRCGGTSRSGPNDLRRPSRQRSGTPGGSSLRAGSEKVNSGSGRERKHPSRLTHRPDPFGALVVVAALGDVPVVRIVRVVVVGCAEIDSVSQGPEKFDRRSDSRR